MSLIVEERPSDSPFIEMVMRGRTIGFGSPVRPAETHWHMVFTRHQGSVYPLLVGPLTTSGRASWGPDAEILWIKFRLGSFMPHMPVRDLLESAALLPDAGKDRFWLKGSSWEFPDFENVEVFVDRLAREGVLARDKMVEEVLKGGSPDTPARTLRHRFLRATGYTRGAIGQFERARKAVSLLESGMPVLDTVFEAGYYDQPHLTRALKRWIGQTPAQIQRAEG